MPFGFGLSFSSFKYGLASVPTSPVSLDAVRDMVTQTKADGRTFPDSHMLRAAQPVLNYAVNVTNTGNMDADEVVLGFLKPPGAGVAGTPLKTLYGFDRVHLKVRSNTTFSCSQIFQRLVLGILNGKKFIWVVRLSGGRDQDR